MERTTRQRRAILEAFRSNPGPMSPQELLRAAKPGSRGLGIATVYRAIRALVDEGALKIVELPGLPPRYEPSGKGHHHHFECRSCGKMFEVEGCRINLRGMTPKGIRIEDHEIFLYGRCRACAS